MGFEKTLKREVGIAAIYMLCLAKHVHGRFTDHLDQRHAANLLLAGSEPAQRKSALTSTNQGTTQPDAARDHGAISTCSLSPMASSCLFPSHHGLSPTGARPIAHIFLFLRIPRNREASSSACECFLSEIVTALCEIPTFSRLISIEALALSRNMIKCDNLTRLRSI